MTEYEKMMKRVELIRKLRPLWTILLSAISSVITVLIVTR